MGFKFPDDIIPALPQLVSSSPPGQRSPASPPSPSFLSRRSLPSWACSQPSPPLSFISFAPLVERSEQEPCCSPFRCKSSRWRPLYSQLSTLLPRKMAVSPGQPPHQEGGITLAIHPSASCRTVTAQAQILQVTVGRANVRRIHRR